MKVLVRFCVIIAALYLFAVPGCKSTEPQITITVNRDTISFTAITGSGIPDTVQTVTATFSGVSSQTAFVCSVSYSGFSGWLTVTPVSGVGMATLQNQISTDTISAGIHAATVTITDPGSGASADYTVQYNVKPCYLFLGIMDSSMFEELYKTFIIDGDTIDAISAPTDTYIYYGFHVLQPVDPTDSVTSVIIDFGDDTPVLDKTVLAGRPYPSGVPHQYRWKDDSTNICTTSAVVTTKKGFVADTSFIVIIPITE